MRFRRGLFWRPIQQSWGPVLSLGLACACLGFVTHSYAASEISLSQAKSRVTIGGGVRLRESPQVSATEVTRLPIGTVIETLEQSSQKETINGIEDYWYRVSEPGGKQGWIFGGLTASFDPARSQQIYQKIIEDRLKNEQGSFMDFAEVLSLIDKTGPGIAQPEVKASLELDRLNSLRLALAAIPIMSVKRPPFQSFIQEHEQNIVFSEPAGQWFVRAELYWAKQKEFKALPIAERFAWAGANAPLPGECEGFFDCELSIMNLTYGKYLKAYSEGTHADECVNQISMMLKSYLDSIGQPGQFQIDDRAGFTKELKELRQTIELSKGRNRAETLKQLDKVAQIAH